MSPLKVLPAWLHAVADYAVGALLVIVALTVDMSTAATVAGVVVGATVLVVSMATKYPLGLIKVLPFRIHSLGDYAAVALLFIAPFALDFNDTDAGVTAFYLGAGAAVLAVSLITNYQYGEATQRPPASVDVASVLAETAPVARGPRRTRHRRPKAGGAHYRGPFIVGPPDRAAPGQGPLIPTAHSSTSFQSHTIEGATSP